MPAKRMSTTTAQTVNNNSSATTAAAAVAAVATSNNVANGMTRLTPARDLTLGGRGGTSKKVFAPNLNAVRNKNANVKTSKDFTQVRGGRRGARGGTASPRGRGGGATGNSTLIQTTGVFSEGAGAVHIRKSSSGSVFTRMSDEANLVRKRTDRKDDKSQDSRVQDIIDDSDTSDGDEPPSDKEIEVDKTELAFKPVSLAEGLWRKEKPIEQKNAIIPDLSDQHKDSVAVAERLQQLHVAQAGLEQPPAQYGRYPRSIGAFLDGTEPQLFVMQLPNVLPCVEEDSEDFSGDQEQSPGSTCGEFPNTPPPMSTASVTPKYSLLAQLEEGQIGKILRYRSGRVKLILGEARFDLDMGLESGFLQELMSISTNREQRSGNMVNLGPIQAKLRATPDWVHLFEQQEAAARRPTTATLPTATNGTAT